MFSIDTISQVFASFFLNKINDKNKNNKFILSLGQLLLIFSVIFQGPAFYFLPNDVLVIAIGIILNGIGSALTNISSI